MRHNNITKGEKEGFSGPGNRGAGNGESLQWKFQKRGMSRQADREVISPSCSPASLMYSFRRDSGFKRKF